MEISHSVYIHIYKKKIFLQTAQKQKNIGEQTSFYHGKQHGFFRSVEKLTLSTDGIRWSWGHQIRDFAHLLQVSQNAVGYPKSIRWTPPLGL